MARRRRKGVRRGLKAPGLAGLGRGLWGRRGDPRSRAGVLVTGAVGAVAQYFFDPQDGKRRRNVARDRIAAFMRRRSREAGQAARYAGGVAKGAAVEATPGGGREDAAERLNDPALARKVESEIFREEDAPKGSVSVNVEHGVVYLRGEVEQPEQIRALGEKAEAVEGVQAVENLLHPPGTPAPSKGDGRAAGRVEGSDVAEERAG